MGYAMTIYDRSARCRCDGLFVLCTHSGSRHRCFYFIFVPLWMIHVHGEWDPWKRRRFVVDFIGAANDSHSRCLFLYFSLVNISRLHANGVNLPLAMTFNKHDCVVVFFSYVIEISVFAIDVFFFFFSILVDIHPLKHGQIHWMENNTQLVAIIEISVRILILNDLPFHVSSAVLVLFQNKFRKTLISKCSANVG